MSWHLQGTYLETCSCDMLCPCTWSAFTAPATYERCTVVLAFHVEEGEVEGVDVSGLSAALVVDAPQVMGEGGWRAGVLIDDAATPEQAERLTSVMSGALGGPPAALSPLITEILGVQSVPISFEDDGGVHRVRMGEGVDVEVAELAVGGLAEPVRLTNVFHPASTTLTVSPASRARVDVFGIGFGREGESGFSAPFRWAA